MKKVLLTAVCLFIASPSQAVIINNLYCLIGSSQDPSFVDNRMYASGYFDTMSANGQLVVGDAPFFGAVWSANEVWVSNTSGWNTWSGMALNDSSGNPTTSFNYRFNLASGNVAFGLYFDWSINDDIPVLTVMHPEADGSWSPVDQVWYQGTSTTPRHGMQTAPFPGQLALFGADPVPEPASLLLIGSGLAGLVGAARRRCGR